MRRVEDLSIPFQCVAASIERAAEHVARRHRFAHDLHALPEDVELHVLPTGGSAAPAYNDVSGQLRIGRVARTGQRQIDSAYEASRRYLAQT